MVSADNSGSPAEMLNVKIKTKPLDIADYNIKDNRNREI